MRLLNCPSCSAPLQYREDAESVLRCEFCGHAVIIPSASRLHQVQDKPAAGARGRWGIMAAVLVSVLGLGVAFALLRLPSSPTLPEQPIATLNRPATPRVTPNVASRPVDEGFHVALSFGEEGIGPGRFDDARHIALDGDGNLYVGEYSDGRIQRFDPTGRFLTQWQVGAEQVVRALAADRSGTVYVVQRGNIRRFDGATGEELGSWTVQPRLYLDGVYPTPDGGLLAYGGGAGESRIIRWNAAGETQLAFDPEPRQIRAALDGLGNIYVLGKFTERGSFNEAVFKYDAEGRFVDRFGTAGSEPGEFRAPHAITVDGRGRVYVSDINGIHVFSAEGRFLKRLNVGGSVFGMVFNDQDELFIVNRNDHRVLKLVLE